MIHILKKSHLVMFILSAFLADAQVGDSIITLEKRSVEHARKLNKGILVVMLETQSKSLQSMAEAITLQKTDGKNTAKLEETLRERKESAITKRTQMIKYFSDPEYYSFSEVYFMDDTSAVRLKGGEHSGFFIDENGLPDESLSVEGRDYYIMYFGRYSQDDGLNIPAAVTMDHYFNPLDKPFPRYIIFRRLKLKEKSGKPKAPNSTFKFLTVKDVVARVNYFYNVELNRKLTE